MGFRRLIKHQVIYIKYIIKNCNFILINVLVHKKRPYWRSYYPSTNAVIYVIDSADRDRLQISK